MAKVELKEGINSYVTIEDADSYIESHFLDNSPEYKAWFSTELTEENKMRLLISSTTSIDNLFKFRGKKLNDAQILQFPRVFAISPFPASFPLLFISQYYDNGLIKGINTDDTSNGLNSAKEATIVNAVAGLIINPNLKVETNKRILSGITSKREGNVSASFDTNDQHSRYFMQGIYNIEAIRSIFKSWLADSVTSL